MASLSGGHLCCTFGTGITELQMYENHEFVAPVNILILPALTGCMPGSGSYFLSIVTLVA